jgi:hypothetical protein
MDTIRVADTRQIHVAWESITSVTLAGEALINSAWAQGSAVPVATKKALLEGVASGKFRNTTLKEDINGTADVMQEPTLLTSVPPISEAP